MNHNLDNLLENANNLLLLEKKMSLIMIALKTLKINNLITLEASITNTNYLSINVISEIL